MGASQDVRAFLQGRFESVKETQSAGLALCGDKILMQFFRSHPINHHFLTRLGSL